MIFSALFFFFFFNFMVFCISFNVLAPALPLPVLTSLVFSNTKDNIEKTHFTAGKDFCTESASKPPNAWSSV